MQTRRTLVAAGGLSLIAGAARALVPATPRQATGPYYPATPPVETDADLARLEGAGAAGALIHVEGTVRGMDGRAVPGARVELWQANAAGRYVHPLDGSPAPLDPHFQGFGVAIADAAGRYRFRTIEPGAYPGRTPHLHFLIRTPSGGVLTTQMYFARHAGANARDGLYRSLAEPARASVTVAFDRPADEPGARRGVFDIVV